MIVLGLYCGHESGAAVVKDGRIIADVSEERFSRLKHCRDVPVKSISYCLEAAGLKNINEVDYIAYAGKQTPRVLEVLLGLPETVPLKKRIARRLGISWGVDYRALPIYFPDFKVKDTGRLVNVEHHLAHAASAYFTRASNEKCLIFTIDGAGDNVSTAVWQGCGNDIKPLEKLYRQASIGWAYSVVTEALHWWHGDGEGKTMGLAPYGDREKCRGVLDKYFPVFNGTKLIRPTNLGTAYHWIENSAMQWHFDEAWEVEKLVKQYGAENIAAEAQYQLEKCVQEYVFGWIEKTNCLKTAYSGGVFLNVKLNQRIWNNRKGRIAEQHIFPNCGDSGLALGAALHTYYQHNKFEGICLEDLYWGPAFDNSQIRQLLDDRMLDYRYTENPARDAARLLADNKILGWFQGRSESGPRALGNRSILMSPLGKDNKDIINAKVKFREAFRPFCPSLLWEKRHEYLQDCRDEFFMITSFDVRPEKADKLPGVVHVDGTLRPQMVKKQMNPLYWELINEFGRLTGEYIILNTSFNIKGEPIVNHPCHAIRCFFDNGMDALVLGNYIITKNKTAMAAPAGHQPQVHLSRSKMCCS
jgi:carbamoyltransferase